MSKLGRGSAAVQVRAQADRFSNGLLVQEERAFTQIRRVFGRGSDEARRAVEAAQRRYAKPSTLRSKKPLLDRVAKAHVASVHDSLDIIEGLAGRAADRAAASMRAELQVCERTLARRYEGVAEEAVSAVVLRSSDMVEVEMVAAKSATTGMVSRLRRDVQAQMSAAADHDELLRRLFSPTPAGLRGFGGRGVWWWPESDVRAIGRAVSIGVANLVREASMVEFNRLAGDRDG